MAVARAAWHALAVHSARVRASVQIFLKFPSRRPGSLGTSQVGRVAEWITATWLRFTCTLFVLAIVLVVVFSNAPASEKLMLIVLSPLAALFYWYALLFSLLICRYLGTFGIILAHVLVIYFYMFSGLVVQRPPSVALRLTRR
jgi:hypothetical protein